MVALIFADDIAVYVVLMGVMVCVNRKTVGDARPEK